MKTIEVSAAIIKKDNRVLATARGYGEFIGLFEFPGGKKNNNESFEEALIREIKEELNADITIDKFLTTIEHDYKTFHLTMNCYICSLVNDSYELLEHIDSKWLTKEELDSVSWVPADVKVVNKIIRQHII